MTYTGEIQMTYRLLRSLELASFTWRRLIPLITTVVAVTVTGALQAGPAMGFAAFVVFGVFFAVMFYPITELLIWRGWRRVRRLASEPWRYEIGPTLTIATPQSRVVLDLAGLTKVRVRKAVWLLTIDGSRAQAVIPRAAFSPEDALGIDGLLARAVAETTAAR